MKGFAIAIFFVILIAMPMSITSYNDLRTDSTPVNFSETGNTFNKNSNLTHVVYFNNVKYVGVVEKYLNNNNINYQAGKNYIDIYGNHTQNSLNSLKKYGSALKIMNNTNSQNAVPLISYIPSANNNGEPPYVPQNIWSAYNLTNYSANTCYVWR